MSAELHARLVAALDEEQARAEAAEDFWDTALSVAGDSLWSVHLSYIAAQDPARTLARVAADRRVLARHQRHSCPLPNCPAGCNWDGTLWPCADVHDLAARYGIEVES